MLLEPGSAASKKLLQHCRRRLDYVPLRSAQKHQNTRHADTLLTIELNGHNQELVAEIEAIDRKVAVAQIAAQLNAPARLNFQGCKSLLITNYAAEQVAEEYRRANQEQ